MTLRREDFAGIINERGYKTLVEMGVDRGMFSAHLLKCCPNIHLVAVDIWEDDEIYEEASAAMLSAGMARFTMRCWAGSDEARRTQDYTKDFIYIDALHDYDSVLADIQAWWPKVRKGGMLAGHDYNTRKSCNKDVKGAVRDFFTPLGRMEDVKQTDERCPSWYITI